MKILIIDDEQDVRDIIAASIETHFDADIIEAESGNKAIAILKAHPDIDLVICDYKMTDGDGYDVYKHIEKSELSIAFILCSGVAASEVKEFNGKALFAYVQKPRVSRPIIDAIKMKFGKNENSSEIDLYCKIRTRHLLRANYLNSEVYLKLNDLKYIKIFNSGDVFSQGDFSRYSNKNIEYLYIRKDSVDLFFEKIQNDFAAISQIKDMTLGESYRVSQLAVELIRDLSKQLGFKEEIQNIAKTTVDLTIKAIRTSPNVSHLLDEIISFSEDEYYGTKAVVLSHLVCGLAKHLGLESETVYLKLTMAAFLHDIAITNPKLLKIRKYTDLMANEGIGEFSPQDMDDFLKHPEVAAQLVRSMKDIPEDIDKIVIQHHERPDGDGIPERLTFDDISPLSTIFIVAEDLVMYLLENKGEGSVMGFLMHRDMYKGKGYFDKVMEAISSHCT